MPTGYPKSGVRAPRTVPASTQTQQLLDVLADIEERIAVQRAKDAAIAKLVKFIEAHNLTAADLRDVAKQLSDRKVGGAPVQSQHLAKAKKAALGRKIKEARVAKGLKGVQLAKLVGAKGTAAVAQWEGGSIPSLPKYRTALIKHLALPKDFFADAPSRYVNGAAG